MPKRYITWRECDRQVSDGFLQVTSELSWTEELGHLTQIQWHEFKVYFRFWWQHGNSLQFSTLPGDNPGDFLLQERSFVCCFSHSGQSGSSVFWLVVISLFLIYVCKYCNYFPKRKLKLLVQQKQSSNKMQKSCKMITCGKWKFI